jgi:putative ABC transport system permease protein
MSILRTRWRKVLRDIWDNKARTILVVLAIAIGVMTFAGVFTTRSVLLSDMNASFLAANPPNIIMNVSSFDEDLVHAVEDLRPVRMAEGRAALTVQVGEGADRYTMVLYAVQDYDNFRINRVEPELGVWPPGRREVVVERTNLPFLNAGLGETLPVELASGEVRNLTLAGTVHDINATPANLFPILTGYVTLDTLRWLEHPGTFNELRIAVRGRYDDVSEIEPIAEEIRDRVEAYGFDVGSMTVQESGKHWAADVTNAFTAVLAGVGVFALVLSAFLVLNTISAVLAQQKRQIGMIKAIGGTRRQVVGIYLVMVGVFGAVSLVLAVPFGLLLGWFNTVAVAQFLNINIINFHLPVWVLILQILVAILAPIAAALLPVMRGTRITVREAVSDYGIGRQGSNRFDDLLASIRGLPRLVSLSLRNTFRRKGRLILTLSTLTLAGAIFIAVINVRGSLQLELYNILDLFNYDVQVGLDDSYQVSRLEREALRVPGVTSVEAWSAASGRVVHEDGTLGSTFDVLGPPVDTAMVDPVFLEGRWLRPDDRNAIVLSTNIIRNEPEIKVGDTITLDMNGEEHDWRVVGIFSFVDVLAYTSFDDLSRAMDTPGQASAVMIGTPQHDLQTQNVAADAVKERFQRSGIGVAITITQQAIIGANASQFDFMVGFLLVMAVMMAIVGGLGLAGTMSLNVLERTREIGVLRAIGAGDGPIRAIILRESLLIGVLSWALGGLLAVGMTYGFALMLGMAFFERPLPFTYSIPGTFVWLLLVLVIATLASLLPARRATHISVREALAYE